MHFLRISTVFAVCLWGAACNAATTPSWKERLLHYQYQQHLHRHQRASTSPPPSVVNSVRIRHHPYGSKFATVAVTTAAPLLPTSSYAISRIGHGRYYRRHDDDDDDEENLFDDFDADEWDDEAMNDEEYYEDEAVADSHEDHNYEDSNRHALNSKKLPMQTTQKPKSSASNVLTPFAEYKWQNYGTRSKVEQTRRQNMQYLQMQPSNEQRAINAAVEHYMRVKQEGQCRRPLPRVITVQSVHPDASKTYTPHCTVLFQCAEDTGCCSNHATICSPIRQDLVQLYFYTKNLGGSETKVEKLSFYNHTECACLAMNSTQRTETQKLSSFSTIRRCNCPQEFTPHVKYDSHCLCECDKTNSVCKRMAKGQEYFGLTDRKCILENRCALPICEHGIYIRDIGRCQRKLEKITVTASNYRRR